MSSITTSLGRWDRLFFLPSFDRDNLSEVSSHHSIWHYASAFLFFHGSQFFSYSPPEICFEVTTEDIQITTKTSRPKVYPEYYNFHFAFSRSPRSWFYYTSMFRSLSSPLLISSFLTFMRSQGVTSGLLNQLPLLLALNSKSCIRLWASEMH